MWYSPTAAGWNWYQYFLTESVCDAVVVLTGFTDVLVLLTRSFTNAGFIDTGIADALVLLTPWFY